MTLTSITKLESEATKKTVESGEVTNPEQLILQETVDRLREVLPQGRFTESIPKNLLEEDTYTGVNKERALAVLGNDIPEERSAIQGTISSIGHGSKILIVGAGWGRITNEVKRVTNNEKLFFLDINAKVLENINKEIGNRVQADAGSIPFPKGALDLAIMSVVLRYNLDNVAAIFEQVLLTSKSILVTEYGEHGEYVVDRLRAKYGVIDMENIAEKVDPVEQDKIIRVASSKIQEQKGKIKIITRTVESVPYTSILMLLSIATNRAETVHSIAEKSRKSVAEIEEILTPFTAYLNKMGLDIKGRTINSEEYSKLYDLMSHLKKRKLTQYIILGNVNGEVTPPPDTSTNKVE